MRSDLRAAKERAGGGPIPEEEAQKIANVLDSHLDPKAPWPISNIDPGPVGGDELALREEIRNWTM
jgi:hypothetical protein